MELFKASRSIIEVKLRLARLQSDGGASVLFIIKLFIKYFSLNHCIVGLN